MKRYIFTLLVLLLNIGIFSQDVRVRISDSGTSKIPIAVMDFRPLSNDYPNEMQESSHLLSTVLRKDLDFSPFFNVIDTALHPYQKVGKADDIDFFAWNAINTQFLVYGEFEYKKNDLLVEISLHSVLDGRSIYKNKYRANYRQARRIVHGISDDISKVLTGEEGVARTQIAFVSDRDGNKEIFICDYDGYGTRQVTMNDDITICPAYSPEGDKLSFTSYKAKNPDFYIMDLYRNKFKKMSDYPGLNAQGAWSPDGRKVALCLTKDGNSEIYLMDTRNGLSERLTYNWGIDTSPCFSPTGDEIAFTSDRSGTPQIYIMDVTGANVRRLTYKGKYNDLAAWNPRGDKLAYATQIGGQFQIAVVDINGSNERILTSIGSNESPSWSPDGYHIVFCSNRIGTWQLYQMNWDSTDLRRITNTKGNNTAPVWSPRYDWSYD
ncbi:MAG: Tol-Pal system beta propeller repeat protein TolB [Candidatus Zixiibacteriota bacterium]